MDRKVTRMRVNTECYVLLVVIIIQLTGINTTLAFQVDYSAGYRSEYSDNITRVNSSKQSEWIDIGELQFVLAEESYKINANIDSGLEYRSYRYNIYEDAPRYFLISSIQWAISPKRLDWVIEDYYGQVVTNASEVNTAGNIQDTNVFLTGPNITLYFGPKTRLELGGRFSDFYYELSPIDSERYSVFARSIVKSSANTERALNLEIVSVNFDDDVQNTSFKRGDVFFRQTTTHQKSVYEIDVGGTEIQLVGSDKKAGYLARISWVKNLTTASSLDISLLSQYTDTGHDIYENASQEGEEIGSINEQMTGEIFYDKRAQIAYRKRGSGINSEISLTWRDEDYESSLDRIVEEANFEFNYGFSETTVGTIMGQYRTTRYTGSGVDKDLSVGLRLSYRLRRALTAELELRREQRETTRPAEQDYIETRGIIGIRYDRNR